MLCASRSLLGRHLATASLTPSLARPAVAVTTFTVALQPKQRTFATATGDVVGELDEVEYHSLADEELDGLQEIIEDVADDHNLQDLDTEYSMGVLTIDLGDKGTFVLNKQAPNQQLWFSSPISGPARYNYARDSDAWLNVLDGRELRSVLQSELEELVGIEFGGLRGSA